MRHPDRDVKRGRALDTQPLKLVCNRTGRPIEQRGNLCLSEDVAEVSQKFNFALGPWNREEMSEALRTTLLSNDHERPV